MTRPGPAAPGDVPRPSDAAAEAAPHLSGDAAPVGRGSADPVRALIHRHHELCAYAVDPLEIAAGLEAHGVTDRTAARFRHRDVFSLAEELYARVPREDREDDVPGVPGAPGAPGGPAAAPPRGRACGGYALGALHLVPGVLGAAVVVWLARAQDAAPGARVAAGAGGAVLAGAALWLCLARGPLKARGGGFAGRPAGLLRAGWLVAYALCGDWLLAGVRTGEWRPYGAAPADRPLAAEAVVVLALAVAPAAWCARWFARRARRRLAASRGLEEFAAGARPLLAGTVALFLCALPPLVFAVRLALPLPGRPPGAVPAADAAAASDSAVVTVCVLLFVARLLAVHGFRGAAAAGTAVACAAEAAVLAGAAAGRLPGGGRFAEAVAWASAACAPAAIPAAICGATALALLAYAFAALSRASAHSPYAAASDVSELAAPLRPTTTRST
ncbi:hypothetical protein [Streptomyces lonegramiae]|uniref:Integral membrane protein n=1 Tax=Streptomyces lonegramiae TaxID=3075524 RepID=A0ABU2XML5_9ACTN|nr:hypothetical protein [Streptomyces sp. DSM 41529]MDT0547159.1 hypothetical protein [Streptomyces sp. DSM 41529]